MEIIKKFEPLFGEWYAESFIGAGSFGRVYKIYREELGNKFYSALKFISIPSDTSEIKQLRADGMDDASISTYYGTLARDISSETTLMNQLRGNTNIVSFEDSRIIPKPNGIGYDIFIRMELLDSLTNRMVEKPFSQNEVVKLGSDICNALILCAKTGIIHRDIKPDNIFVSPNGDYKLGDFGIARQLEKTATFMSKKGTYNYMAPEVYKGEKYGATCDLYSLGLVMYRLLNKGRLPFLPAVPKPITANDREEALKHRFTGEQLPVPCDADEELSSIILTACAYEAKDRFASAEAMRTALQHYASGEHVDLASVVITTEPTEGTEDGPTESAFVGDSSVDPGEESKTSGVFAGVPLTASGIAANQINNSASASKAQQPQEPTPQHKQEEKKKKKIGMYIGAAAAVILATVLMVGFGAFGKKNVGSSVEASEVTNHPIETIEATAFATSGTEGTDKSNGVMTYAEYVATELETEVTIETYVQAKQSWLEGKATVYTQDKDGAYFIYNMVCSKEDYAKLVPGTKIKVTGRKSEWSGEVEIVDATFEIEDGSYIAAPVDLTDVFGTGDLIKHMNEIFAVSGAVVEGMDDGAAFWYSYDNSGEDGSDLYFKVKIGENVFTFTVESYLCDATTEVYNAVKNLKVGDTINVEGFLYWYKEPSPHIISINTTDSNGWILFPWEYGDVSFSQRIINPENTIEVCGMIPKGSTLWASCNSSNATLTAPSVADDGTFKLTARLAVVGDYTIHLTCTTEFGQVHERDMHVQCAPEWRPYVANAFVMSYDALTLPSAQCYNIKGTITEIIEAEDYYLVALKTSDGNLIHLEYHHHFPAASELDLGKTYNWIYGHPRGKNEDGIPVVYVWFVNDK